MFSKSAFFAAIFVFLGFALQFASAEAPPACIIACVNEQPKVGDFNAICKSNVAEVVKCLDKACRKEMSAEALDHYKDTCKIAGINVVMPTASASTSATASSTKTTATPSATAPSNGTNTDENSSVKVNVGLNTVFALAAVFAAALAL